jgi:hypothetical protein
MAINLLMKFTPVLLTLTLATSWPARAAQVDISKLPPAAAKEGVTYAKDIRPIFEASCFRCHGEQRPKNGLRLDTLEGVLKGSKDGQVITAGKSAESQLVIAVARLDEKKAMPPKPRAGRGGGGPGGPGNPNPAAGGNAPTPNGGASPQGPGGGRGPMGPPAKPLTPEQVGLVRAWIDQGAK